MGRRLVIIMAAFAIALAGCGGDDDDEATSATTTTGPGATEAQALQDQIVNLSDKAQIERIAKAWVEPFAAGDAAMCGYLHPDLGAGAKETCAIYAEGGLAGSNILQASFAGTRVERVEIKGQYALVTFSGGEPVAFQQDPEDKWWVLNTLERAGAEFTELGKKLGYGDD